MPDEDGPLEDGPTPAPMLDEDELLEDGPTPAPMLDEDELLAVGTTVASMLDDGELPVSCTRSPLGDSLASQGAGSGPLNAPAGKARLAIL